VGAGRPPAEGPGAKAALIADVCRLAERLLLAQHIRRPAVHVYRGGVPAAAVGAAGGRASPDDGSPLVHLAAGHRPKYRSKTICWRPAAVV
jgi:hypothetical protein